MIEIIAHRGASRSYPENTMEAFQGALDQGADGIELDVHRTADGVVIVHHDPVILDTDGHALTIAEARAAAVRSLRLRGDHGVPTLDEVLLLVGGAARVYVEVKGAGAEAAVSACLERHPAVRTAVHAFDHRIPVAVRASRPGTPVGLLSASYPLDVEAMLRPARADALWQHTDVIDAALVERAHATGARVIAWTENRPAHAERLAAWGVDAICTDVPGELRQRLARS